MTDDTASDVAHDDFVQAEPSATDVLRSFEDHVLGADAVRINGNIERGSGSWFQTKLTPQQRAIHAALVKMIETEQAVADAKGVLAQAEAAYQTARAQAEAATNG